MALDDPSEDLRSDRPRGRQSTGAQAIAWAAIRRAKRHESAALHAIYGARRAAFVARLRLLAAWNGATVDIDVAPDVRLGKEIAITVWPGSRNTLRIGPGCVIGDRVLFFLKDGRISLREQVEVRRDTVFMMWGGSLDLSGGNILSWGNVIHCAGSIRFGRLSSTNEGVTVVDSSHYFTEPDSFFYHNHRISPIEVGYNSWICAKATLAAGARVGDHCVVAANSLVTGRVPDGQIAAGVPAKIVRTTRLPWRERAAGFSAVAADGPPRD